jgi:hypothetical protein
MLEDWFNAVYEIFGKMFAGEKRFKKFDEEENPTTMAYKGVTGLVWLLVIAAALVILWYLVGLVHHRFYRS